jgi:hypothetical protein
MANVRGPNYYKNKKRAAVTAANKSLVVVDLKEEKLREEVRNLKLKNEILLKDYYPAAEVLEAVSTQNTRIRQKLLTLEFKLPPVLASLQDPIEIKKIIQQEVFEILEELSYQKTIKGFDNV